MLASGITTGVEGSPQVPVPVPPGGVNDKLVYCHLPPQRHLEGVQHEPGARVGGAAQPTRARE
jgi:hypothetical protein